MSDTSNKNKKHAVYCHFSFKRPKGKNYGIFSVALFADKDGKYMMGKKVRAFKLWEDHQYITAIQSYEHALYTIWEWQQQFQENNVDRVYLVTDNVIIAGWILDPNKNKQYEKWMYRASSPYKLGGSKEIFLSVGLMEVVKREKSYKYCDEKYVTNKIPIERKNKKGQTVNILTIEGEKFKTALDLIMEEVPDGLGKLKEITEL